VKKIVDLKGTARRIRYKISEMIQKIERVHRDTEAIERLNYDQKG